jgi:phage-related protein (TIGR01555 family)
MASKHNGKLKEKRITLENSGPINAPLSGIFDMGGDGDTAAASLPFEFSKNVSYNLVSLLRLMLAYSYVIFGPLRTLVDQPVKDAMRGGIKIKSDEVGPEDIEALEKELKRIKYWRKVAAGLRWARLFGGAGLIINVNEDYSKPLDINRINEKSKLDFKVADRWELAWNGIPEAEGTTFQYYGLKLHPSRVAKIMGEEPPSIVAQRLQGWGMSVIECVLRELNSYFKDHNVIFEFLDEAKVDVWKIKGFNSQILSKAAQGTTAKRIKIATQMKNFLNAITLDSEDDYQQKQITFSGISEILEQIRIGIAAAIRMPMAKIFGLAAKGFASGEDDIENYNAMVETVRDDVTDVLDATMPAVCMKVWGFVPSDLSFVYKPLRVLSAEAEEIVKNAKFTRASSLYGQGILNAQEYCELLKEEDILVMETEVSKGAEPEPPQMAMMEAGGEPEGGEGKKTSAKGKKEKEQEG